MAGPIHDASAIGFDVAVFQSHLEGVKRAYAATKFFDSSGVQHSYKLGNELKSAKHLRDTLQGHLAEVEGQIQSLKAKKKVVDEVLFADERDDCINAYLRLNKCNDVGFDFGT
ncbi:transposase, IS605 OrfB family [Corchorus capsularis]|uniref:Transposase, IS605 OrfB family n=1 Tax=Corchorus capsularis TaxID=210143 RepID=A0A1R3IV36_COCAP|nr:transposase, IS605 OrfB family [Corchorus capsularis]